MQYRSPKKNMTTITFFFFLLIAAYCGRFIFSGDHWIGKLNKTNMKVLSWADWHFYEEQLFWGCALRRFMRLLRDEWLLRWCSDWEIIIKIKFILRELINQSESHWSFRRYFHQFAHHLLASLFNCKIKFVNYSNSMLNPIKSHNIDMILSL